MISPEKLLTLIADQIPENSTDNILSLFPCDTRDVNKTKNFLKLLYIDYRFDGKNHSGKRLSKTGVEFFSKFYESFECKFSTRIKIITKYIVFLNTFCKFPYYLDGYKVIFFDIEMAFDYKMSSDTIADFCTAFEDKQI